MPSASAASWGGALGEGFCEVGLRSVQLAQEHVVSLDDHEIGKLKRLHGRLGELGPHAQAR